MSRVDDGARSLDGLTDRGIQSHGVTRAGHLRFGQQLKCASGSWHTITARTIVDGEVTATCEPAHVFHFQEATLVPVRDILHTYTESDTSSHPDYDDPCETCANSGLIPGWTYAEIQPGCWGQSPCPDCDSDQQPTSTDPTESDTL